MPVASEPRVEYNRPVKTERYDLRDEPEGFTWFNRPDKLAYSDGLTFTTRKETDFWQRTHYGFRKDNGHALIKRITGDFTFTTEARFKPLARYDQCGLFARIDAANWLKASIEYEGDGPSKLGTVVTNLGYSDWSNQEIGRTVTAMHYRLSRRESDILVEWSRDGEEWHEMRITHMHAAGEEIEVGVYACSPIGDGCTATFTSMRFENCRWKQAPAG